MDLITRANREQMEEEKKMCDALKELFAEELREADEKGMAKGMELAKRIFGRDSTGVRCYDRAGEGTDILRFPKLLDKTALYDYSI